MVVRGWQALTGLLVGMVCCGLFAFATKRCPAQIFEHTVNLDSAEVTLPGGAVATHLENARQYLAAKQWDDAIEAIRRVAEEGDSALMAAESQPEGFGRYIPLEEFSQWKFALLASEAPEALRRYRAAVDPLAAAWLAEPGPQHREAKLQLILHQAFASSWGDEALLALGDLARNRGEWALARSYYHRIAPQLSRIKEAVLASDAAWSKLQAVALQPVPLEPGVYPDTNLPLAEVWVRLVLCSLLEGSKERAKWELEFLRRQFGDSSGSLAGRKGKYHTLLTELGPTLLPRSILPSSAPKAADWPMFAGDLTRNAGAAAELDFAGRPTWSVRLPRLTAEREVLGTGLLRPGDDPNQLRAYHPIVVGNLVLNAADMEGKSVVTAYDRSTGQTNWKVDFAKGLSLGQGEAVAEPLDEPPAGRLRSDAHRPFTRHLGVASHTLFSNGQSVYGRLGWGAAGFSQRRMPKVSSKDQGFLIGLELATQGKILDGFPIYPESSEWNFDGSPLVKEGRLYVLMRQTEQGGAQIHLACFDLPTTPNSSPPIEEKAARPTGQLLWRTKILSARTLGGGDVDELANSLLALSEGRIYCNTQQGAIASVDATSGSLHWVTTYPRAKLQRGEWEVRPGHFFRDLTPSLVWRDLLICAPADCDRIFALERISGKLAWTLPAGVASDAVHLLGVKGDNLLASGDYLYWFEAATGNKITQFPSPGSSLEATSVLVTRGLGRGAIAGEHVYFPTRESLFVFNCQPHADGLPRGVREIPLLPRGVSGGNLVFAGDLLLLTTGDGLFAFDEVGPQKPKLKAPTP